MASETMASETTPQEELSLRRLLPETIPPATANPVGVIIGLRKDLAEFQKVSNKETFKETLRKELREALLRAATAGAAGCPDGGSGYPNIEPIVEYLQERRLVRPKLSRARIRRLEASLPPNERDEI
jgi:hypothetical protein